MVPSAPFRRFIIDLVGLVCVVSLQRVHLIKANNGFHEHHACLRKCEWPPNPMVCRYEFTVEWFYTMSTDCFDCPLNQTQCSRPQCIPVDGVPRAIIVVNKQFPGPSIQVCEHDTIEVKVLNNLINGETVVIHWHGVHQRGTPHMDGTPLITQCPIQYRSSFTYRFKAETVGTHFWHAHGPQLADGPLGSLVIRQAAPDDVHSGLYHQDLAEHVLLVQDWTHTVFMERYSQVIFHDVDITPNTMLVNGKGRSAGFPDKASNRTVYTPFHTVHVQQNTSYRFRTIGVVALDCFFEVSIDGHNLTVIASDGAPFEPVQVRAFGISSGERFDFVLDAEAEVGKYWIRVKGIDSCEDMQALALLVYEGAAHHPDPPEEVVSDPRGIILNPFNKKSSKEFVNMHDMIATGKDYWTEEQTDVVHYLVLGFELVNNDNFNHPIYNPAFGTDGDPSTFRGIPSPQMNYVTFKPPSAPLLTQSREISEFEICTFESTQAVQEQCRRDFCECTHVLKVALGQVVELVLIDRGQRFSSSHPMHLHGYRFQVLAHDRFDEIISVEEVKRMDEAGNITRRYQMAPMKDTIQVPERGYVVIRFKADNPGWWQFHCHTEFHFLAGMSILIHVGTDGDLPPIPQDFPRCGGHWYPKEDPIAGGRLPTPSATPSSAAPGLNHGGIWASVYVVIGVVMAQLVSRMF
ncbi:laccase-5-like [Acanthaster planci]|uniref:Laccase-5-like n=1 Tax=Acanthaster planci TaxID=133434 RepID=A0A8B7Y707_ACAPL|nr:laccase-5-like [Acanthaster planci]